MADAKNTVTIVLHPDRFEVRPKTRFPEVKNFEKLKVAAKWAENRGKWGTVTVQRFQAVGYAKGYDHGASPSTTPISEGNGSSHDIEFCPLEDKDVLYLTYEVVYTSKQNPNERYTLDPAIKLVNPRPGKEKEEEAPEP
jgi:hypothetical protein